MGCTVRINKHGSSRALLCAAVLFAGLTGCQSAPLGSRRVPASSDRLESALDQLKTYILAQRKSDGYWSAPFTSDVSSDAIALALAQKIGKLTPDLVTSTAESMYERMTDDHGGWPAYVGGPADYSNTSIALLALQVAGISNTDSRFQNAWTWFNKQGGVKKMPLYATLMLAPLDLVPNSQSPALSPRAFGMPTCFPIYFDREGFLRGLVVPSVAIGYLESLPDRALEADAQTSDQWRSEVAQMGHYSLSHSGNEGTRKCVVPDANVDAFFEQVDANRDAYQDCVFYPEGKGTNFFTKLKNFFKAPATEKLVDVLNFVIDHAVTGTKVFWTEQALILELQQRNPGAGWYTTGFTMSGIRLLQEAQRVGLGTFQSEIDQAWDALEKMRITNQSGQVIQQWVLTGTWDTASTLVAFEPLKGTSWELPQADAQATVDWLLSRSVRGQAPGTRGWSFDQTDSSLPDVDDTALVLAALSAYMPDSDPVKPTVINESVAWLRAHQNTNGGFPSWSTSMSRFLVKLLGQKMMQTLADFSQPDVTGRVLFAYDHAQTALAAENQISQNSKNSPETSTTESTITASSSEACSYLMNKMPKMKDRSLALAQGNWMVNYVYSAASVLTGLTTMGCGPAKQAELAKFIMSTQQTDGGWGESPLGYSSSTYVAATPTIMQSAVALAGLIAYYESLANNGKQGPPDDLVASIQKGIDSLIDRTQGGTNPIDQAFSGVLVRGVTYARYELAPAYLALYTLGRWERLRPMRASLGK